MPLNVVYGRPPLTLASYQQGLVRMAALEKQTDWDAFLADIRESPLQTQNTMKQCHNGGYQEMLFEVGD